MKDYNDYTNEIEMLLQGFDNKQLALYSTVCCERFIKFFEEFDEITQFGKYNFIRNLLNMCWEYHIKSDENYLNSLIEARNMIIDNIPDGADYPGIQAFLAQNVGIMLDSIIQLCLGTNNIIYSTGASLDSIFNLLWVNQWSDLFWTEELEKEICKNPIMEQELLYQKQDIADISNNSIDEVLADILRKRAIKNQYSIHQF
jgi:uncharacterized protein YjaG (DUF416 family)